MNPLQRLGMRLRSSNTRAISPEDYARCYQAWGGSFIVHPEVLQFCQEVAGVRTEYRGYFDRGECIGVVPTWGADIAGNHQALRRHGLTERYDFGYPVLRLAIAPGRSCRVRYRADYLVGLQRPQLRGALFPGLKHFAILRQIPDELPQGKKEFQIKERRFLRRGGAVRDIRELPTGEVVAIYADLFAQRWGRPPHALATLAPALDRLGKFLFGAVLYLGADPIAIQINYRAETDLTICVDYINGGVDKRHNEFSPGSLLSYFNGREACGQARATGKQLIYSYGKANTAYKDQWCRRVARGFSGYWLP